MKKLSILLLLMLSSCQALGPNYLRQVFNLPEKFSQPTINEAAENTATRAWWKHYQDAKLNELVELSLKNNTDIQLAVARIEEADASMREVGASLFPEVSLSADATRTKVTELGAFPVFIAPIRNNYTFGFNTNYELDFWGKIRRAKEAATANALASRYSKQTVELSLIGLVSSNYLQLRGIEAQIAVTKDNQRSRQESLNLTQRRLDGGIASSLEVSQAEVAVSNLNAQLIELNRLRALSLHQLAVLTGVLDLNLDEVNQADIRTLPIPPIPPAGLPSALLENRPDIRQAEQTLIAENAQIGIAKAALYPSISLTGSYGGESLELGNLLKSGARIWTLGLGLDLPIFDSGRRKARVDQATARQKQALAQYQTTIQNAFREVNDALVTRRLNVEREQSLAASEASAKKALVVAENRYKAGYSAYLEVLDAQRVHNDAALANVQARQATSLASVELFKVLGGDWRESTQLETVPSSSNAAPSNAESVATKAN
ncbi:MAG: RND transporter [Methylotenera sp.]|nr:MAG: RND transporter [Methylotenera sp.]